MPVLRSPIPEHQMFLNLITDDKQTAVHNDLDSKLGQTGYAVEHIYQESGAEHLYDDQGKISHGGGADGNCTGFCVTVIQALIGQSVSLTEVPCADRRRRIRIRLTVSLPPVRPEYDPVVHQEVVDGGNDSCKHSGQHNVARRSPGAKQQDKDLEHSHIDQRGTQRDRGIFEKGRKAAKQGNRPVPEAVIHGYPFWYTAGQEGMNRLLLQMTV